MAKGDVAQADGYKLTDGDRKLILGSLGSNIGALHFDGPVLLDMVAANEVIRDKLRPGGWR